MASRAPKIDPRKSAVNAPGNPIESRRVESVNEYEIAALAYLLWQERGCPVGSDQEDWFKAESELKASKMQPTKAA